MKITVGGLKGGIGKTTTAVHLATALARLDGDPRVLLIDADPQSQSAFDWATQAAESGNALPFQVLPWATPDLPRRVRALEMEYRHIVIDTGGETATMFRAAVAVAPELVIPVRANNIEVRRVPATLAEARTVQDMSGVDIYPRVLFVAVKRSNDEPACRAFMDSMGVPMFTATVRDSVLYSRAFGDVPGALGDYASVCAELLAGVEA